MERDLHDSAQQRLIALRMHVDLARGQSQDPQVSRSLSDVGDEIDEALTELRSIAHGIYPALLEEAGLGVALTQAASHFGGFVDVEAVGVGRYSEDVEKGVFFCIMEAVQNAAKHAGQGVAVRVSIQAVSPDRLRFEVADRGQGFDSSVIEPGFGIASMTERMSALDGRLGIVSEPGTGTTVSATLSATPREAPASPAPPYRAEASPRAAAIIAGIVSGLIPSFRTHSSPAPESSAASASSTVTVISTTTTPGTSATIRRAATMPLMPGMWTSMKITLGFVERAISRPSSPVSASPTSTYPADSMTRRSARR